MPIIKRPPLDDAWRKRAFCKGMKPQLWELDSDKWKRGRKICITDCPVRAECLRDAMKQGDTDGVIRGGIPFDTEQFRRKKLPCVLCGWRTAPIRVNRDGTPHESGLCNICRKFVDCLNGCGRMVVRIAGYDSYYCNYCSN